MEDEDIMIAYLILYLICHRAIRWSYTDLFPIAIPEDASRNNTTGKQIILMRPSGKGDTTYWISFTAFFHDVIGWSEYMIYSTQTHSPHA